MLAVVVGIVMLVVVGLVITAVGIDVEAVNCFDIMADVVVVICSIVVAVGRAVTLL